MKDGKDRSNTNLHLVKGSKPEEGGSKPDTAEEKKNVKLRLREMMEMEEDDAAWDDDKDEGNGRPWMTAVTFLGLAVLAAIICAILWYFTHPEKPEDGGQGAASDVSGELEPGEDSVGGQAGDEGNAGLGQNRGDGSDSASGQTAGAGDGQPGTGEESQAGNGAGQLPGSGEESQAGNGAGQLPGSGEESQAGNGAGQLPGNGEVDQAGEGTGQLPGNHEEPAGQDAENPEPEADPEGQEQDPVSGTSAMKFTDRQESVTPKDAVNLRSVPTTTDESNIVVQCRNGEILTRTGINGDTGWSRLDYDGQTLYAVTQYLTTNLDYKPPVQASDPNRIVVSGGRVIIFSNCDDWISPKEYVNLRTEPSTDEGNDTVSCQLNYGEKAHRTGYSADSGWSRVEYDGKVLYVVTSLVYVVDPD